MTIGKGTQTGIQASTRRAGTRRGLRNAAMALGAAAMLSGCAALSLIGSESPPATFDLRAMPEGRFIGRAGGQLAIREPHAIQVLDNERIVFRPSPQLVTYYAGAQWADRLPLLVEQRLLAAFEHTTNLKTVSRTTDGLRVDFQLLTEIRDFGVTDETGGKVAEVRIYAKVIADDAGRALSGREFEGRVPVTGSGTDGAVGALDTALSDVLTEIVRWTVGRI